MDTATIVAIVACGTLAVTLLRDALGGGWKLGGRLTSIESNVRALQQGQTAMQEEVKKLTDVLIKMADIRGELNGLGQRIGRCEEDIKDLRRGRGFIQGPSPREGLDVTS